MGLGSQGLVGRVDNERARSRLFGRGHCILLPVCFLGIEQHDGGAPYIVSNIYLSLHATMRTNKGAPDYLMLARIPFVTLIRYRQGSWLTKQEMLIRIALETSCLFRPTTIFADWVGPQGPLMALFIAADVDEETKSRELQQCT